MVGGGSSGAAVRCVGVQAGAAGQDGAARGSSGGGGEFRGWGAGYLTAPPPWGRAGTAGPRRAAHEAAGRPVRLPAAVAVPARPAGRAAPGPGAVVGTDVPVRPRGSPPHRGPARRGRTGPDAPVCGRWWESSPGAWTGVLGGRVWTLRQERDRLWYTVYGEEEEEDGDACPEKDGDACPTGAAEPDSAETEQILRDYFQLDVGLPALYRAWGAADPLFRKAAKDFPGEVAPWGTSAAPAWRPLTTSRCRGAGAAAGPG